jgi:Flp pilus assembly pilin Flp
MLSLAQEALLSCIAWLQSRSTGERGQTLAEYALIITIVAVGTVILCLIAFREMLIVGFNAMSSCLQGSCGS